MVNTTVPKNNTFHRNYPITMFGVVFHHPSGLTVHWGKGQWWFIHWCPFCNGSPSPGVSCWYVWQGIFRVPVVKIIQFSNKCGAAFAPTRVIVHFARYTSSCFRCRTLACSVFICTITASFAVFEAFLSEMVPALAFQASDWFSLDFLDVTVPITNG